MDLLVVWASDDDFRARRVVRGHYNRDAPGPHLWREAYRQNQARAAAVPNLSCSRIMEVADSPCARLPSWNLPSEGAASLGKNWCGGDTRLPHISTWDTSQVTDMSGLFSRTSLNESDGVEDTSVCFWQTYHCSTTTSARIPRA